MDIRIFALVAFIAVLGSFTEARSVNFAHGGLRVHRPSTGFATMSRLKREIDGESTTNQATTTTSSTTDTTTPPSTTPPSSTTPSTEPTTTPTTTTEATTPTTTPTTTSDSTTPTTPLTTPTTPSTTSAPSTTTESTTPQPKSDIQSRSNTDEPEDPNKKPGPSPKDDKAPTPGPNFGAPGPNFGALGPNFGAPGPNFGAPGFGFGGYGPGFDPYFSGYPGYPQNSVPGYGPNYAWTGTNNGPGYASAGASAGGFGYPGMGYPMGTFPTVGSPTAFPTFPTAFPTFPTYPTYPTFPTGSPMGSPSFNSRGGFPDTSPNQPNQDNSPKKENSPNQIGYNFGGDPFAGPGFFPGQFPGFNDPTFDMIKQIQAQIEAQQAMAGNYGGGQPNYASASIGLGPYGGFQSGQISPASPGIESRFAEELPAPSGNSFGTFASSSSSSSTGPDGEQINHKSSITGVNDNGKISFRTVYD